MRQLCFTQGIDTRIHVFVADACAFVTSLYPVRLARHGYGRLCMGRDMVYRFGLSVYHGMGRNRIWKGYRWDTCRS